MVIFHIILVKEEAHQGVVVYGNGRTTTTSNNNNGNVSGVTYYNVGRSSTSQDDNIGVIDNNDIRIRTYKDFVKNNSGQQKIMLKEIEFILDLKWVLETRILDLSSQLI